MLHRVRDRSELLLLAMDMAPSRACNRAMRAGHVEFLGGFTQLPPYSNAGWLCRVRSKHGRIWLLAILVDEIKHTLESRLLEEIPWKYWAGDGHAERTLYGGDNPITYAARRRACVSGEQGDQQDAGHRVQLGQGRRPGPSSLDDRSVRRVQDEQDSGG